MSESKKRRERRRLLAIAKQQEEANTNGSVPRESPPQSTIDAMPAGGLGGGVLPVKTALRMEGRALRRGWLTLDQLMEKAESATLQVLTNPKAEPRDINAATRNVLGMNAQEMDLERKPAAAGVTIHVGHLTIEQRRERFVGILQGICDRAGIASPLAAPDGDQQPPAGLPE